MGAWGVKLYDNDVAEDIKNTYKEKLQEGKSNEEATDEIISDYEYMLEDVDDAPLFWMALADQQWKVGRLLPNVKEQALKWIEKGADFCCMEIDNGTVKERRMITNYDPTLKYGTDDGFYDPDNIIRLYFFILIHKNQY